MDMLSTTLDPLLPALNVIAPVTASLMLAPSIINLWRLRNRPQELAMTRLSDQSMIFVNSVVWLLFGWSQGSHSIAFASYISIPIMIVTAIMVARARKQIKMAETIEDKTEENQIMTV